MFSQQEIDYILSLINTYRRLGYQYYMCHTVTEDNNVYDICIYFSQKEIKAVTSTTFDLSNAIQINIDSSSRNDNSYNGSTHSRDTLVSSNLTKIINVNAAEFIYTNATVSNSAITLVNSDLTLNNASNYQDTLLLATNLFMCSVIFLYLFFKSILRLKR